MDLHDPFIVENGGAVHGETSEGEEWQLNLGPGWRELRPQLQSLERELGEPLRALDDLADDEGDALLGLRGEALRLAQGRSCSVPFVAPSPPARERLVALAEARQLTVVQGNRLSHLLGGGISGTGSSGLEGHLGTPVRARPWGFTQHLPSLEAADLAEQSRANEPRPGSTSDLSVSLTAHGPPWRGSAVRRLRSLDCRRFDGLRRLVRVFRANQIATH